MPRYVWARDLPPFDEDADCPKCASGAVGVLFHSYSVDDFPCRTGRWLMDGHLCRVCERCGYGWCEAALDTKPAHRPELRAVGNNEGTADH
jgi:hypothetical protein